MIRSLFAVVVGIATWFVVATVGNWVLRAALPGYSEVEKAMHFSLAMLLSRLVLGLVSSFCAGAAGAAIAKRERHAISAMACVLILLFLPVHYALWAKFPLWYHAFFLGSLAPPVLLGAATCRKFVPATAGRSGTETGVI